jgi:anti-sigma-K factor RskA
MTEVNGMNCAEFADVAAELSLGVLTGRERADALAHLDDCDACAANARPLTVGEQLIGLLSPREPPLGFETRVLERLGFAEPRHRSPRHRRQPESARRARRLLAAAAAAVAVAGAGLGGWWLHVATSSAPPGPAFSSAALLAADHQNEGEVVVYKGEPRWMYLYVHLGTGSGLVICQLEGADGRVTTMGSFRLTDGNGSWGSPGWVDHGAPIGARLLAPDGAVLATASFPRTAS